jgi:HD-GYP domain-containing protein (c-di-GMP phosphodiesterase class II)
MKMKSFLYSFLTFWKPGVGRRLTVYFTITGLIIGYLAIIILVTAVTRDFIRAAASIIRQQFLTFDRHGNGDFMWRSINTRRSEFTGILKVIKSLSSEQMRIVDVSVYCLNTHETKWYVLRIDDAGYVRASGAPPSVARRLDADSHRACAHPKAFFWGGSENFVLRTDVTGPADRNRYILNADINRAGLASLVDTHRYNFLFFTFAILLVSHVLGHFFSWRIAGPIELLSEGAAVIAKGNYRHRFEMPGRDEFGVLASALNTMADQTEKHITDITEKMNAMETMNRIDKATLSSISRDELLNRVIGIVSSFLPEYSIGLAVKNDERMQFEVLSHYDARSKDLCREAHSIGYGDINEGELKRFRELFQVKNAGAEYPAPRIVHQVLGPDAGSIVNYPIYIADQYLGSLVVSRKELHGFSDSEIRTIGMLADQTGVALQSVRLTEDRERLFMGILRALSRAIDAKSRWTAGHSERVSLYCERIGQEMGLLPEEMRTLSMSAILHDIGKIGVPEQVLDKPGKLSDEEFSMIRTHCRKGADIIGDMPYYGEILNGILYHHERWDGTGYPEGLAGKNIPINARIIAVADVYDALTSDRPYRPGWEPEKTLAYLEESRESLFDPEAVDCCIKVLKDRLKENIPTVS